MSQGGRCEPGRSHKIGEIDVRFGDYIREVSVSRGGSSGLGRLY